MDTGCARVVSRCPNWMAAHCPVVATDQAGEGDAIRQARHEAYAEGYADGKAMQNGAAATSQDSTVERVESIARHRTVILECLRGYVWDDQIGNLTNELIRAIDTAMAKERDK